MLKKARINGRGQTEYSWIFSLIIGAAIIFFAIYFATKYVGTSNIQSSAEIARNFDILLNPFASIGSITTLSLSKEVTMPASMSLNFTCNFVGDYDNMAVKLDDKRADWFNYKIYNKYIFSENLQGRNYWVFSKSLYMPWRVDDMIYIVSDKYCFVGAPESIRKEIIDMGNSQVSLNCTAGSKKVCFGVQSCDINVNYDQGIVRKNKETLTFSGDAMMYGAVFSDNSVYKCNMLRMMKRLVIQSDINIKIAEKLGFEGCSTNAVRKGLIALKSAAESNLILNVEDYAREVKGANPSACPIF